MVSREREIRKRENAKSPMKSNDGILQLIYVLFTKNNSILNVWYHITIPTNLISSNTMAEFTAIMVLTILLLICDRKMKMKGYELKSPRGHSCPTST